MIRARPGVNPGVAPGAPHHNFATATDFCSSVAVVYFFHSKPTSLIKTYRLGVPGQILRRRNLARSTARPWGTNS